MVFYIIVFLSVFSIWIFSYLWTNKWEVKDGFICFGVAFLLSIFSVLGSWAIYHNIYQCFPKEYDKSYIREIEHLKRESMRYSEDVAYTIDYSIEGSDSVFYFYSLPKGKSRIISEDVTFVVTDELKPHVSFEAYRTKDSWWSTGSVGYGVSKASDFRNIIFYSPTPFRFNQVKTNSIKEN